MVRLSLAQAGSELAHLKVAPRPGGCIGGTTQSVDGTTWWRQPRTLRSHQRVGRPFASLATRQVHRQGETAMRGRVGIVLGVAIVLAVGAIGVPAASAANPVIDATGDVHCEGAVKVKGLHLPIVLLTPRADGTTMIATVTGKLTCTGATGNSRVSVKNVKVTGQLSRTYE